MKPHTDEPLSDSTPARTRRGLLSRKGARRSSTVAAALSLVMLLSSCMSQGDVTETRADQLSLGDAVIAVRLSEGKISAGLPTPPEDNWIVLLDAQGRGQATRIEAKRYGSVAFLWTDRGLSFGAPDKEYVTTDQGTQEIDVKEPSLAEDQRFSLSDGRIVVVDSGEEIRVDVIHPNGRIVTTEIPDTSGSVGQCGQHIVGITDTEDSESIRSAAFEAYAAQSGGDMPENVAAVFQIDELNGGVPRLLAVAPAIDGLLTGRMSVPCDGNVITVLSIQQEDPAAVRSGTRHPWDGVLVLQRWDLSTGQRTIIPVLDEAGQPIETDQDNFLYYSQAIWVGDEYRFVTKNGNAYAVDVTSGNARHLFSIPSENTRNPAVFQVSETGVYALEQNDDEDVLTLSYQPWNGGGKRVLLTTGTMSRYLVARNLLMGYRRSIQSFALRPGWNGGAQ
ncbi:hypothetical protein QP500_07280 [Pauljensenia sp. UMB0018B]|uniref:Uncharacterized protein n=1 Tax=Schaalia odontolytica TaxID=1660 RepID=A0A2I1HZ21_9ACTO|nr:hypothetical protein [Schaalia odontolytica]MDK7340261.1 hypothetical protein [Pauljensenia sp. UMB0018B]PKY64063.1 hypothetical protein CYJ22_07685 [Schaalia odontolytica]